MQKDFTFTISIGETEYEFRRTLRVGDMVVAGTGGIRGPNRLFVLCAVDWNQVQFVDLITGCVVGQKRYVVDPVGFVLDAGMVAEMLGVPDSQIFAINRIEGHVAGTPVPSNKPSVFP